jgi:ribulose-5-phosphate 4-epimerase/fuculose-1-phosphate aldolase
MPPALVEGAHDLIEYWADGSDPVDPNAKKGYSERFIHGEIFKRYPQVNCVVHSHAEAVIPYVTSTVPLLPMYHMAGFLQGKVNAWDITPLYGDSDRQDMLVNTVRLGASLAEAFGGSKDPDRNVVLMKRHGYTTWGPDIPTACFRAVYTLINAGVQTNATLIQSAAKESGTVDTAVVTGLTDRHAHDCQIMLEATQDKSWRLWSREVEASPVYRNSV